MRKVKYVSAIFILIFGIVVLFFISIGSVSIAVSPTTDLQYLNNKVEFSKNEMIDLSKNNIFTYGISFSQHKQYNTTNIRDEIFNAKFNIKTITINSLVGGSLITFNVGQKTSLFDLFAPTSHAYLSAALNSPLQARLSYYTIMKIGLLLAAVITSIIMLIVSLKKYLEFKPKIRFIKSNDIYSIRSVFIYCVIIFVISKVIFGIEYLFLVKYAGYNGEFFFNMCFADVGFYRQIIHDGYIKHIAKGLPANWAFFPLFPMLVRSLMIFGLPEISGIYLNQVFLFGSYIILFMYVQENYNLSIAKLAILFLSFSSENIYFMTLYSESTYLFFSVLSIYLLSKNKLFWSSVCCGMLSANRFIGFAMIVPIFFKSIQQHNILKTLLFCMISISGLLVFMIYFHFHVNDFLAFYHIQNVWRHTMDLSWVNNPLWTLYMTLVRSNLMDKLLFTISFFMLYTFYQHKKYNELWLLAILMFATFSSKSLGSYTRFIFAAFPMYIYLGIYAATKYGRMIAVTIILLFMHFLYLLFWLQRSGSAW